MPPEVVCCFTLELVSLDILAAKTPRSVPPTEEAVTEAYGMSVAVFAANTSASVGVEEEEEEEEEEAAAEEEEEEEEEEA
jgi:N-methylhydantoinase A/oxoprolinase/acetone carboxylase beta subunit